MLPLLRSQGPLALWDDFSKFLILSVFLSLNFFTAEVYTQDEIGSCPTTVDWEPYFGESGEKTWIQEICGLTAGLEPQKRWELLNVYFFNSFVPITEGETRVPVKAFHVGSTGYNRDGFMSSPIYKKVLSDTIKDYRTDLDAGHYMLVNSPSALKKLLYVGENEIYNLKKEDFKIIKVKNLYLLESKNSSFKDIEDLVKIAGISPPFSELMKHLNPRDLKDLGLDFCPEESLGASPLISSSPALDKFWASSEFAYAKERSKTYALFKGPVRSLEGIKDILGNGNGWDKDPFVKGVLAKLQQELSLWEFLEKDKDIHYERIGYVYNRINDLQALLLAYLGPYSVSRDYQDIMQKSFQLRYPPGGASAAVDVTHFPANSGMDALIIAALAADPKGTRNIAKMDLGAPHPQLGVDHGTTYFELQQFVQLSQGLGGGASTPSQILVSGIESTTDLDRIDQESFVKAVVKELERRPDRDSPFTLILDETLNLGEASPFPGIIDKLKNQVEAGVLTIIISKSLQKFPTLGTGKYAAGNMTVISKKGSPQGEAIKERITEEGKENQFDKRPHWQGLLHTLKYNHQTEFDLLEQSIRNAQLLKTVYQPSSSIMYTPPFLFYSGRPAEITKVIPHADSFPYAYTIHLNVLNSTRVTVGFAETAAQLAYEFQSGALARVHGDEETAKTIEMYKNIVRGAAPQSSQEKEALKEKIRDFLTRKAPPVWIDQMKEALEALQ